MSTQTFQRCKSESLQYRELGGAEQRIEKLEDVAGNSCRIPKAEFGKRHTVLRHSLGAEGSIPNNIQRRDYRDSRHITLLCITRKYGSICISYREKERGNRQLSGKIVEFLQ